MTEFTDFELTTVDIDWYATDVDGHIGHFSSNAGPLPRSVSESQENWEVIADFFDGVPATSAVRLNPRLQEHPCLKGVAMDRYLISFYEKARKGFFSHDTRRVGDEWQHILVAVPLTPRLLSTLPENIRELLQRTQLPGCFGDMYG